MRKSRHSELFYLLKLKIPRTKTAHRPLCYHHFTKRCFAEKHNFVFFPWFSLEFRRYSYTWFHEENKKDDNQVKWSDILFLKYTLQTLRLRLEM